MIQLNLLFSALALIAQSDAEARCGAPSGSAALLAQTEAQVLVIGELHGTNEAPGLTGSILCLAISQGERVVLGLEMSADHQGAIDAYLASDGGEDARAALLSNDFWTSDAQDGRSSAAIFRLIDGVRGWRDGGLPVEARALDFGEDDHDLLEAHGQKTVRDRSMIRRALGAQVQSDRVVMLVGNVHARRTAFMIGERRLETLGTLSDPGALALVSTLYAGGEAWNCRHIDGELACAAHPVGPSSVTGEPRVLTPDEAEALRNSDAYDHFIYLGPTTASPPAIDAD
jgi:hypothetical protein